jgi:hypothetical protein
MKLELDEAKILTSGKLIWRRQATVPFLNLYRWIFSSYRDPYKQTNTNLNRALAETSLPECPKGESVVLFFCSLTTPNLSSIGS